MTFKNRYVVVYTDAPESERQRKSDVNGDIGGKKYNTLGKMQLVIMKILINMS